MSKEGTNRDIFYNRIAEPIANALWDNGLIRKYAELLNESPEDRYKRKIVEFEERLRSNDLSEKERNSIYKKLARLYDNEAGMYEDKRDYNSSTHFLENAGDAWAKSHSFGSASKALKNYQEAAKLSGHQESPRGKRLHRKAKLWEDIVNRNSRRSLERSVSAILMFVGILFIFFQQTNSNLTGFIISQTGQINILSTSGTIIFALGLIGMFLSFRKLIKK